MSFLLAAGVIALGGVVRGFAGFGAAMIIVPLLSWLYSASEAVVTCAVLELVGFIPLLPAVFRFSQWGNVRPIGIASILAVPLGVWLLVVLDPLLVRRIFSVLVLIFVVVLASNWRARGKAPVSALIGVGGLSGTLAGLASMGGPPVVLYYLSQNERAVAVRANIIALLMAQTFAALVLYFLHDLVSWELVKRCLIWGPIYALALWAGAHLFQFSSEQNYRRIALFLVAAIGLATLFA